MARYVPALGAPRPEAAGLSPPRPERALPADHGARRRPPTSRRSTARSATAAPPRRARGSAPQAPSPAPLRLRLRARPGAASRPRLPVRPGAELRRSLPRSRRPKTSTGRWPRGRRAPCWPEPAPRASELAPVFLRWVGRRRGSAASWSSAGQRRPRALSGARRGRARGGARRRGGPASPSSRALAGLRLAATWTRRATTGRGSRPGSTRPRRTGAPRARRRRRRRCDSRRDPVGVARAPA